VYCGAGHSGRGKQIEQTRLEAEARAQAKVIADKLSDKVQIMMVPSDGKFFFANDVMHGIMPAAAQPPPATVPVVTDPDPGSDTAPPAPPKPIRRHR
jgi:hypothetical protein